MTRKKKRVSLPRLKQKAWDLLSLIKRQLYADHRGVVACVTCGREHHWKEMDAGHYTPKSRGAAAYFDWHNIHPQCTHCNRFLHGNLGNYAIWLCDTYGREEVDRLSALGTMKINRAQYEEMIEFFKACEAEL